MSEAPSVRSLSEYSLWEARPSHGRRSQGARPRVNTSSDNHHATPVDSVTASPGTDSGEAAWRRYEELRPDELAELIQRSPVAFWPLGLIEHHGWHLPVGYDGLKAGHLCERIATRTGGVILPVMWWGAGGGHDRFLWTHYQDPAATAAVLTTTAKQLMRFGFRALIFVAGHYPWQGMLDEHLPAVQSEFSDRLLLWGTEISLGGDAVRLAGDHAALEETSYGLALFPHLVSQEALCEGRDDSAWPDGKPPEESRHPGVCFDPANPLFAQMGEDARSASAERVAPGLSLLVDHVASRVTDFLSTGEAASP